MVYKGLKSQDEKQQHNQVNLSTEKASRTTKEFIGALLLCAAATAQAAQALREAEGRTARPSHVLPPIDEARAMAVGLCLPGKRGRRSALPDALAA